MFCYSRTIPSIVERPSEVTTWSSMRFSTTTISASLLPRLRRINPQPKPFRRRDSHVRSAIIGPYNRLMTGSTYHLTCRFAHNELRVNLDGVGEFFVRQLFKQEARSHSAHTL